MAFHQNIGFFHQNIGFFHQNIGLWFYGLPYYHIAILPYKSAVFHQIIGRCRVFIYAACMVEVWREITTFVRRSSVVVGSSAAW